MAQQITSVLRAAHGFTGKLPAAGLAAIDVQGVPVWVEPLPAVATGKHRPFALRVQSSCPQCGWTGAFGRFHQHICKPLTRARALEALEGCGTSAKVQEYVREFEHLEGTNCWAVFETLEQVRADFALYIAG